MPNLNIQRHRQMDNLKSFRGFLVTVFLLGITSCGSPASLSGKYQSPDGKQGFEFLADNNVILHEVDKNQQLAGKYEILKGEDAQKLKISGPAGASVVDIEIKGDSLILKQGKENLVFRKVDRFAVPTP